MKHHTHLKYVFKTKYHLLFEVLLKNKEMLSLYNHSQCPTKINCPTLVDEKHLLSNYKEILYLQYI